MSEAPSFTLSGDGIAPLTPAQMQRALNRIAKPQRTEGQADIEDVTTPGRDGPETVAQSSIAVVSLRSVVARIERLDEERMALVSDIRDIYTEAKSSGIATKVLRTLIAERRKKPDDVEHAAVLLDIYRRALGG
jgi:uncharacterized protein (UPF0335 family)